MYDKLIFAKKNQPSDSGKKCDSDFIIYYEMHCVHGKQLLLDNEIPTAENQI